MTSPLPNAIDRPSITVARGHGLLGVASMLLWAGVAFAARGSALGGATLLAALVSLAWLAVGAARAAPDALSSAPRPAPTARPSRPRGRCQRWPAMLRRCWRTAPGCCVRARAALRVESPLVEQNLDWPPSPAEPAPAWWQDALAQRSVWLSTGHAPARWAVSLRLRDVRVGVLAFERRDAAHPASARDGQMASAVATLVTHLLLCQHLQARLDELGEQQARERRMFLANLSHKLRTPMTAILGFAQILALDDSLVGEQREFVREIETASHTLLELLNELVGIKS